ncbi:MAG: hypothetical protein K2I91_01380, partial [Muribaculaceae bacterium]|nr:hypothetical protein [Muribaculaceae bacterium]
GGRIIYIIDSGIGERFTPKGIQHTLCDEGRLLIIGFDSSTLAKVQLTRERCEEMNRLALEIAQGEVEVL